MRARDWSIATVSVLVAGLPATAQNQIASSETLNGASTVFDPVIVTALNREENAQSVPIVVSVFSGEDLAERGARNLQDVTQFIAGVDLFDDRGAGQPTWVIRGVGLVDFNSNNSPTASIFDDGVYLGSNVLAGLSLFDLDRIEVLKGPQGGLYGRNTTGGAVRYLPIMPNIGEPLTGYVEGRYGRWDEGGVDAALAGPIGDRAAFRVAATTQFGGGWQDSLVTPGDDDHGDRDFFAVRAQLLAAPSDDLALRFKLDFGQDNSETPLLRALAPFDLATGGPCAAALAGRPDPDTCVTWSNITTAVLTDGEDFGLLPNAQDERGKTVLSEPINVLENEWVTGALYVDYDLGSVTLHSITALQEFDGGQIMDYDGSPLALFNEDTAFKFETLSQELRLAGPSEQPFTWQLGLNYAQTDIDENRLGDLSDNVLVLPSIGRRVFQQEDRHLAIFAEGSYDLSDQLSVNGSLRYTDEERSLINFRAIGESDPFQILVDTPGDTFVGPRSVDYTLGENLSGHVGLDYKIHENALLYGKVVRGFKSGGFFGGFALSEDELDPYDEETVWAYEAGAKVDLPGAGLRINGAVFYYDYQDFQGYETLVDEVFGVVTGLGNIGDAEHVGAELEVLWTPPAIEGLTLQAAATWLDTEIIESDFVETSVLIDFVAGDPGDPAVIASLEGLPRSYATEFSYVLAGRYERPINDRLTASANLNWSWRSAFEEKLVLDFDRGLAVVDGYGLLNGSVSVSSDSGWDIALIGQNLTDETYITSATGDDLLSYGQIPGRPSSWQIQVRKSF